MGRFDALSSLLRMTLEAVGVAPRPWMVPLAVGLVLFFFGPTILRNIHTGQARREVMRLSLLDADARKARIEAIVELLRDNPVGLVSIADEALRRQQAPLARRAMEELQRRGDRPREVQRLREAIEGPLPRNLELELVTLEQLVASGAHEAARERLRRLERAFPGEPRLAALSQSLPVDSCEARG